MQGNREQGDLRDVYDNVPRSGFEPSAECRRIMLICLVLSVIVFLVQYNKVYGSASAAGQQE